MYKYEYAFISHKGKVRTENEDNYWVNSITTQDTNLLSGEADTFLRVAIADGMGGMSNGRLASSIAVGYLNQRDSLTECILKASNSIYQVSKEKGTQMGSTISAMDFSEDKVILSNVGDTKIYRYREHKLEQLSRDHTTISFMLKSGLITPDEALNHPFRHQLTQYLGMDPDEMQIEPYIDELKIEDKDRYLICSDGLSDMISNEEISDVLERNTDGINTIKLLLDRALLAGGRDNITIGIIMVEKRDL